MQKNRVDFGLPSNAEFATIVNASRTANARIHLTSCLTFPFVLLGVHALSFGQAYFLKLTALHFIYVKVSSSTTRIHEFGNDVGFNCALITKPQMVILLKTSFKNRSEDILRNLSKVVCNINFVNALWGYIAFRCCPPSHRPTEETPLSHHCL